MAFSAASRCSLISRAFSSSACAAVRRASSINWRWARSCVSSGLSISGRSGISGRFGRSGWEGGGLLEGSSVLRGGSVLVSVWRVSGTTCRSGITGRLGRSASCRSDTGSRVGSTAVGAGTTSSDIRSSGIVGSTGRSVLVLGSGSLRTSAVGSVFSGLMAGASGRVGIGSLPSGLSRRSK